LDNKSKFGGKFIEKHPTDDQFTKAKVGYNSNISDVVIYSVNRQPMTFNDAVDYYKGYCTCFNKYQEVSEIVSSKMGHVCGFTFGKCPLNTIYASIAR
jgi:hypothetical protein